MKTERTLAIEDRDELVRLFGTGDQHLRHIRTTFGVSVVARGDTVRVIGEPEAVERVAELLDRMLATIRRKGELGKGDVEALMRDAGAREEREEGPRGPHRVATRGISFEPKTEGQRRYVEAMETKDIVFSIGPAGTGKTFLAVAMAVKALKEGWVRRLVLTRPAVEAGERLGFLPGGFQEKVNPYLHPLYDALGDLIEFGQVRRLIESEVIEVVPLAYMRGRTLNGAFIILDEGQNTTSEQMKMFLTRMGNGSRIVVTGDITQTDLPQGKVSGLVEIQGLLKHIRGLEFIYLDRSDIVRHPLVQEIVDAYESHGHGKRRK